MYTLMTILIFNNQVPDRCTILSVEILKIETVSCRIFLDCICMNFLHTLYIFVFLVHFRVLFDMFEYIVRFLHVLRIFMLCAFLTHFVHFYLLYAFLEFLAHFFFRMTP